MVAASREVSQDAGWRLRTLLHCSRYFSVSQLVFLYKAQILTFIESRTAALHHAAPSVLNTIYCVQRRFLREVNMSELEAFRAFNLAPLLVRRGISMLGLLYRIAHGLPPNALSRLFPLDFARQLPTRGNRHELQFKDVVQQGGHTDVYRRSCFGVATIWNMLPVDVAHAKTVKICQKRIQAACLI